jgi:trehalose/maltose hydrolase-like predicted phosphorylase
MFTNLMTRWNLRRAATSALRHGGVDAAERASWLEIADALVDGYESETGIYEQFAGFGALEPLVIAGVAPGRPVAADLLLGRDRVRGAQVIKQADVLMAHHLIPEDVQPASLVPNLDFFEPRTAHGSSLSPGVHAALFARAGRERDALHWLRVAAGIDLTDLSGTTAAGVHIATMGSVWQAWSWGFAGVRAGEDALRVDPRPLASIDELELRVRYRGVPVGVRVRGDRFVVDAEAAVPVRLGTQEDIRVCGPNGLTGVCAPADAPHRPAGEE